MLVANCLLLIKKMAEQMMKVKINTNNPTQNKYYYPLANEVAKGYSNATFCPSFRNILVNTLESTSFNGF